ncbi:MAG TPA: transcriptional repressor [Actinomycetales bacterium]|nr:transcriptional repressor [Actinomycetales bacterium]
MATTLDFERMLRGTALRLARPRLAVLAAVHALPHACTVSIFGAVRRKLPKVSHQAVYDVLRALAAAGLVRRIQPSCSRGHLLGVCPGRVAASATT